MSLCKNVTATEIEKLVLDGADLSTVAPYAGKVTFADGLLIITVVAVPSGNEIATLLFPNATIASVWFDENDTVEWPLDIVGFDSQSTGEFWRFVLNCGSVELCRNSGWPSKTIQPNLR